MAKRHDGCQGYRGLPGIQRRGVLQMGALGGLGVTLAGALQREAEAGTTGGARAKNVILLWLQGGVSHHETFDPKPDAPIDVRGEFSTIATKLPGIRFGEHMTRCAETADKFTLIRSLKHGESDHYRGSMYMVEGRQPPRGAGSGVSSGNPELGSIVAHELGMRGGLPPFVSLPGNDFTGKFVGHGWLPATAGAFKGQQSASLASQALGRDRLTERVSLRHELGAAAGGRRIVETHGDSDAFYQQAIDILTQGQGAEAFDIDGESNEVKALYGIDQKMNEKGRYALIARRLIEAGVRYVTIGRNSWDHHSTIFPQLRSRLPSFDAAFSGLILDLEQRGLLDETLVVYLTEYGRTPKVNSQAGRDHWPSAFSVAFAGAGVPGGQVIGATDSVGGAVVDRPISPEQVAATILDRVGINPQTLFTKPDGRPIMYVDHARPIAGL
jgi:uncharacterized protein (DUF1501 family)